MRKYDPDHASGIVEEEELEALLSGDVQGGVTPTIGAIASVIVGISTLTFNATPCPTSSCTKSC